MIDRSGTKIWFSRGSMARSTRPSAAVRLLRFRIRNMRSLLRRRRASSLEEAGRLIGEAKIPLVDHEGSAEGIEYPKEGRDGRGPGGEDRLVAQGPHDQEEPGLP